MNAGSCALKRKCGIGTCINQETQPQVTYPYCHSSQVRDETYNTAKYNTRIKRLFNLKNKKRQVFFYKKHVHICKPKTSKKHLDNL